MSVKAIIQNLEEKKESEIRKIQDMKTSYDKAVANLEVMKRTMTEQAIKIDGLTVAISELKESENAEEQAN